MAETEVYVTTTSEPPAAERPIEVVERKGLGHPDTLCDSLAEAACVALCRFYLEHCGTILHHNVDKVLLVGGQSTARFGGGQIDEPIQIYLAGRAAMEHDGKTLPIAPLVVETCRAWLRQNLRYLDVDEHVDIHCLLRPGSSDLVHVFGRAHAGPPLANDTSCGAGFAPLSPVEALVLSLDDAIMSDAMYEAHPELGEDLKIMAVRRHETLELTVANAFVGQHIASLDAYTRARDGLRGWVEHHMQPQPFATTVRVNAADRIDEGSIYLTVTGTSAEAGDDGEAGRGNRSTGLITPYRPMTLESVAGKNPKSHVGKIYNVLALQLARAVTEQVEGLRAAECVLVSRIGQAIDIPQLAHVAAVLEPGADLVDVEADVQRVVADGLADLPALTDAFIEGSVRVV